jgi:3-deoxy-D-manno-octulosonic-acid transferase
MANTDTHNNTFHWRYQLVLWIAAIPLLCFTLWQALRHRQWRYLWQRLGLGYPAIAPSALWLHAASVGEVLAAEALIKVLLEDTPQRRLLVTTMTPTGARMVQQHFAAQINSGRVSHAYLPIDWRSAVKRFLRHVQPGCVLIMETELWPNLYAACQWQGVPPVIINGRVSERTLQTPAWVRALYRDSLQQVRAILARSQQDADHFLQLGAPADKVRELGNLKFSAAKKSIDVNAITLPQPFILAASTHDDEEWQLAKHWLAMQRNELLVIAPRHPQRSANILKQLQGLTTAIAVRSRKEAVTEQTRIYLADTLGELTGFMASAKVIIMGGSFVPVGGHNVLEPAMLGKAVVFGPHMHNFADETEGLLAQQAAIQVQDASQLPTVLSQLLDDNARRRALGERAQLFMQGQSNILEVYLNEIHTLCQRPGK